MALSADTLLDRLHLKGQVKKWRTLAIVFAVVAAIVVAERVIPTSSPLIRGDYIARVTIEGMIYDDQKLYDLLKTIQKNKNIKAVVVSLDTPGGSAVGGEEIFLRLRELSEKKPVVAVMRQMSASAGYLIALGTDYILAREGTITGSIGVILQMAEITELAKKLGIKPIIIKSAPLKGTPSFLEKNTAESKEVVQKMIDDFYQFFVKTVADRRKLPASTVRLLADGRVYSGSAAVKNKLIDAIGGEKEAVKWLLEQKHIPEPLKIKDVKIPDENNLISQLSQTVAGNFFQTSGLKLDGLLAIWHAQVN